MWYRMNEQLIDKQAMLNSIISNCQIIANDSTLCEMKIDMLRSRIAECETEEDVDKIAYQVISFVIDFMTYRY